MYCPGVGPKFNDSLRLLNNNGLNSQQAKIAAVFTHYNPYDTSVANSTASSYLYKSVQYAMREAGLPVTLTGGPDPATQTYLKRIFPEGWQQVSWNQMLETINAKKDTLAKEAVAEKPTTESVASVPWKTVGLVAGGLVLLKWIL